MAVELKRCEWSSKNLDPLYIKYHDEEWGVPIHDDKKIFEFLTLEGAQAGLSWYTVLKKGKTTRRHLMDLTLRRSRDTAAKRWISF